MKFRYPDEPLKNLLRLLPVGLLVIAVFFTGHMGYRYLTGADETLAYVGIGAFVLIYSSVRTLHSLPRTFIWEHREGEGGEAEEVAEDEESPESEEIGEGEAPERS